MFARDEILRLIPHQGSMCLLDRVLAFDADTIVCSSASHHAADHPLRSGGRLRSVHLCEYGAQAMAVHGGLLARQRGELATPGWLVSLRSVRLAVTAIDQCAGELTVRAERLLGGDGSWQYAFAVEHRGQSLASGRAAVMLRRG